MRSEICWLYFTAVSNLVKVVLAYCSLFTVDFDYTSLASLNWIKGDVLVCGLMEHGYGLCVCVYMGNDAEPDVYFVFNYPRQHRKANILCLVSAHTHSASVRNRIAWITC